MSKLQGQNVPIRAVAPAHCAPHKAIIFDLGEVVFTSERQHYFPTIVGKLFGKTALRQKMFQLLHEASRDLQPHDPAMVPAFPTLLANWLTGLPGSQAQLHMATHLKKSGYSFPTSRLWLSLSRSIFDPLTLVASMKVRKRVAALIHTLKDCGYRLYVLSNWDHVSFPHLVEKHADLFALFDGIMISGHEKIGKPNEEIYLRLLERHGLTPSECLFIDDMEHNVSAAQRTGIRAVRMGSYDALIAELEKIGVIATPGLTAQVPGSSFSSARSLRSHP